MHPESFCARFPDKHPPAASSFPFPFSHVALRAQSFTPGTWCLKKENQATASSEIYVTWIQVLTVVLVSYMLSLLSDPVFPHLKMEMTLLTSNGLLITKRDDVF